MSFYRNLTLTSAFALFAGPAFADLTAEQVLADQLRQIEYAGLSAVALGQSKSGGTLSVSGLEFGVDSDDVEILVTLGGAEFTEQSDGSVSINYGEEVPINFSFQVPGEELISGSGVLQLTGMSNVASGSPEQIRYDFSADAVRFADLALTSPTEASEIDFNIALEAAGLLGFMELGDGDVREYSASYTLDQMSAAFRFVAPGEGGADISFALADLATEYAGAVAKANLDDSLAVSFQNGNRMDASISHGETLFAVAIDAPEGQFQVNGSAGSGDAVMKMGVEGLSYSATNQNIAVSASSTMMPLPPLNLTMAETSGRFVIPVVPGEEPQNFAMAFGLGDLALDDMIWGMIDPAGQLPRDPINIALDVDGELVMLQDVFDPEVMENMTAPPGQINSANLNGLRISIAGAELTGDGAFTFNNQFGIPMPVGVANFMLTGGNTLLDTLVGMGLVPEEQAMGARMMMGLFAQPGEGDDTLISTIEMKEDGSILANGQRIK